MKRLKVGNERACFSADSRLGRNVNRLQFAFSEDDYKYV